ncbi:MAG: hypothetical protein QE285_06610 [Aquabacterium sp.]|nr:hypothetical protein [Aquabacterium sp.]
MSCQHWRAHRATGGSSASATHKPAARGEAIRQHRLPTLDVQLMSASLRHVSDAERGYTRERHGNRFTCRNLSHYTIHDAVTMARIEALAIPPAWVSPR